MTALDILKGVSAYPIPTATLSAMLLKRGLIPAQECDPTTREAQLAVADALSWLSIAPNISQGGQSYSFSAEERGAMRSTADGIYEELGEAKKAVYGYKGSRL